MKYVLFFCLLFTGLFLSAQDKAYIMEVTFLEIIYNGDSVEYGKGNTLTFHTDGKTDIRVIDTIAKTPLGIQFEIVKENGLILAGFVLYRIIDGKWDAFAQFAPVEPGSVKPVTLYTPGKPSIKTTDYVDLPDPKFVARFATAVYFKK